MGAVTNGERAAYDAPIFNRKVRLPSSLVGTGGAQAADACAWCAHEQMTRVRAELLKHLEKTFA